MSDQFLSEIRMMAFNYAPKGWATCDGQSVAVVQNQALYALIGNTFGGNSAAFNLPDLRGRTSINQTTTSTGQSYPVGQSGGEASHTLQIPEMPGHTHAAMASPTAGTEPNAANNYLAPANQLYGAPGNPTNFVGGEISTVGGQPHENRQPYLVLNFSIALTGIFPTRA